MCMWYRRNALVDLPTTDTSIVYKKGKCILYLRHWSIYSQIVSNILMWLKVFSFSDHFRSIRTMMNGKFEIHHLIR